MVRPLAKDELAVDIKKEEIEIAHRVGSVQNSVKLHRQHACYHAMVTLNQEPKYREVC